MKRAKHPIGELILEVEKILWERWDPIGVNSSSDAMGEYDSYAPMAARFAMDQDRKALKDFLVNTASDHIGVERRPSRECLDALMAAGKKYERFKDQP